MSSLVHRWFTGPRSRWMLGLLLGAALVGAQTLAARHELSHLFDGVPRGEATASVVGLLDAPSAGLPGGAHADPPDADPFAPAVPGQPAAPAGHDCPLCLMAAALGGTAVASHSLSFAAFEAPVARAVTADTPRAARTLAVYASRGPPRA